MFCPNPDCPDRIASGSPGEYVDAISECPVCGARLVADVPADYGEDLRTTAIDGDVEVERIFETSDPAEVQIVQSILTGAGIPFLVEGMESFSTFVGISSALRFNPHAGEVAIVVPSARAEEARALLTEAEPDVGG